MISSKIPDPDESIPWEYIEYRFCKEFHCLPSDLEEMDSSTFKLWRLFAAAEADAVK